MKFYLKICTVGLLVSLSQASAQTPTGENSSPGGGCPDRASATVLNPTTPAQPTSPGGQTPSAGEVDNGRH